MLLSGRCIWLLHASLSASWYFYDEAVHIFIFKRELEAQIMIHYASLSIQISRIFTNEKIAQIILILTATFCNLLGVWESSSRR